MSDFQALVLNKGNDGAVTATLTRLPEDALPEGDVTVRVSHSTLNYKDGLVLGGLGGLVRDYPHVPGIDFAGTVEKSSHEGFKEGDAVVLTGWRVGEVHWGGYAEKARVKGDWLVKLQDGLTARDAMAIGTAGFTSMLAVLALEKHGITPDSGPVLVTGATGGVGSVAVALLAKLGYEVEAITGKAESEGYLKDLGAKTVLARAEFAEPVKRPLLKERWAGCVDAVGGQMLANILPQMKYGGSVAAVGLAGGNALETTVIPFLLRGINLLGIDSVLCPKPLREEAWNRLAHDLPMEKLSGMIQETTLKDLPDLGRKILKGGVQGRVVVDIAG